jgi:hypothetical protein
MGTLAWHGKPETIEIYSKYLDEAKKAMTGRWIGFKSKVTDVIVDGDRALITIETCGRLPIVSKRWDKYRVLTDDIPAVQTERRGRGRPSKVK